MDGSMFAFLAEHPVGVVFALAGAFGIGWSLYRHTVNCKAARLAVYAKLDELKDAIADSRVELSSRISGLEAVSNGNHLKEIAALVASMREGGA